MLLMNIDSVIASKNPRELSAFYVNINSDKPCKGFDNSNYFISLSNRFNIHFYLPNENHQWQREGNSTSLCFQLEPCANPLKINECWTFDLIKKGSNSVGLSKLAKLGSELWMLDPE